jgi:glucosamine 6-phosphate synthetase-like amidotransferase/phosphosugar isomerase protein
MCGIIGYSGGQNAVPLLLDGLRRLEYRGYDSAGLAVLHDSEKALNGTTLPGTIGIGHTRWATHGKPSEQMAKGMISPLRLASHREADDPRPLRPGALAVSNLYDSA